MFVASGGMPTGPEGRPAGVALHRSQQIRPVATPDSNCSCDMPSNSR